MIPLKVGLGLGSISQAVMHRPRSIRIKEFFPIENAVTVQIIGKGSNGKTPISANGDHKFPLSYRGDVSSSMAPQPGDIGLLFFTGMQYKTGFVLLSHTPGGLYVNTFTPIRGLWALLS
tara:strand:+ start:30 stop:386 length:357 start_codon:yes stop_codon:yes gene_type:complete